MSFGISKNVRSRAVQPCTPELFRQVVDSPVVAQICAGIEDALERVRRGEMSREDYDTFKAEQKKRLPIFTPHATFKNGRRKNDDAIPSGLSMYDKDHISNPRGYYEERVAARVEELGIVLAHVTPSLEGLRLFFIIPQGMDLAEAQRWMARQLGDEEYDPCVKDYARSSFVVPREYILFTDAERLFNEERRMKNEECHADEKPCGTQAPADEEREEILRQAQDDNTDTAQPNSSFFILNSSLKFKGLPYADIISEWFRLMGGEPQQGERNDKLHRLASHLRYITDNDEALILQLMPRYGLGEEEMRGLIHSACTSKFCSMPRMMRKAIENVEIRQRMEAISACAPTEGADETEEGKTEPLPPPMPDKLPQLIALLTSRTPDLYKPAVAHAVFPSLAAHLWRVRFRYIDNVEHEATLMNVLMAGTGAGKDCISEPINRIMADIRRRDEENLRREREWKNEVNSKGANKDKRQRPEGLVIQEIDADMTNPAFVMRTAEADGHFLYTKMNEIDQFDALKGSSRGAQQFQIMCLAFDPGNRYGQTRVGTQSITEKVTIRFNWNASTTILKGQRYFAKVLTDGPISRINFCTIPEREIGADMPVYGTYDAAFDEQLRPYIDNLNRATGLVDCPQAYKLAMKLKEENAEFARLSQSRVYENLSFRANVIAYLKACVLYVASGCRWDKTMEDFIRWSLQYDLWCKIQFFGEAIEQANAEANTKHSRGPKNLLTLLPEEFTAQDVKLVRIEQGMNTAGTRVMLRQWVHRKYVELIGEDRYRKVN